MKALLLPVLLLSLGAALQAQDDPLSLPEGEADITGTWYTQAEVMNWNVLDWKKILKAFPTTIRAVGDGNLEATVILMLGGHCQEKKVLMKKTKDLGKYSTVMDTRITSIIAIPVKDHFIMYCVDRANITRVARLMGRTPEQNPEALEEFRKFARSKKFQEKKINLPQQMEKESCVSTRG